MTQHDSHSSHHHIVPVAYYVRTFVALLILTVITVAASRVNFGTWNVPIAMFIAIIKASLVGMVFMGLRWDKGINGVFFLGSFVFLGIFIAITMSDIVFRPMTDVVEGPRFGFKQPIGMIKEPSSEPVKVVIAPSSQPTQSVPIKAGK